jgi:YD repeat-containing protein
MQNKLSNVLKSLSRSVLLLLFVNKSIAQAPKPPQITPLSPNAASLWKYAEFPVNMYTGIPSISIPIYEAKSGGLSVPISLNYHAGGNRYEDQSSWVGLGWSLSAGGTVNRNVKGKADEKYAVGLFTQSQTLNTLLTCSGIYSQADWDYYINISKGLIDVQPDEFSYSMPGNSGKFVYKQAVTDPILMPYAPLKISKTYAPDNLSAFQIKDENGTTFRFGNNKLLTNEVIEKTSGGTGSSIEETTPYPGSWLLTEMESADAAHTISFNYVENLPWVQKNSKASSQTVTEPLEGPTFGSPPGAPQYGSVVDLNFSYLTNAKYLSTILFENGKVEFVQTSWFRTDLNQNQRALDIINIYSKSNGVYTLIKKVAFNYSYFQRKVNGVLQNWKLKLNKVQVYGTNTATPQEYIFEYHTDTFSGDETVTPNTVFALDYWGFYNSKTANSSLIPAQSFAGIVATSPIIVGNADRNVDTTYLREGVLKKITYPTGGFSNFDYEAHQYLENSILKYAGGLRVKRITSTESATNPVILEKLYKYGINELGDGFKNFYNELGFYRSLTFTGPPASCSYDISSTQSFQLDGYDGSPVLYPYVTEYFGNTTTNNGKVKYVYDNGSPAQDNLVSSYASFTNLFFRKTNHWKRGFLTQKTVYDKNNNIVSDQASTYQIIHPTEDLIGINLQKKVVQTSTPYPTTPAACNVQTSAGSAATVPYFDKAYIPFSTGVMKLTNNTDKAYDPADPGRYTTNTTNYVYDANYLQPLEVNKVLRKLQTGYEEQVTDYAKYPFNYSFAGVPSGNEALGIKLLQDNNISAVPVEQYTIRKFKNPTVWQSDITAGTITTFRSDKPYPDKIYQIKTTTPLTAASFGTGSSIVSNAFTKNAAYEERMAFTSYDAAGNIMQYNKTNDITNSYIWDYLNTYPVAEVANTDNNNIAFTSFEAESKGNWVFSGTPAADATAPTGKNAYILNGTNNLVKTGLTPGTTYIVSYWIKGAAPLTITGTVGSAAAGRTLGLWKYYEHRITGQTQVTITGSLPVDEVRLYPAGALMTTYTHEPLIGLTSQCDAQNKITYYEYDAYSRLLLIRDQDRNILKTFEYKYKQ